MDILYNAKIHTLNPKMPTASALLIDQGRILAIGEDAEILAKRSSRETSSTYDLGGLIVLPGLTDAHHHLQQYALSLAKVDCETQTLAECVHRIADRARSTPAGEWIFGHGWNQNEWHDLASGHADNQSGGFPTAAALDTYTPDRPVYLTAKSLHAAWVNTTTLHLANITSQTPDPEGGKIIRNPSGIPTGILLESAMSMVTNSLPEPSVAQVSRAIQEAQPNLWRMGLTGVHDFDRRTCFAALQSLRANLQLRLRVIKSIPLEDMPAVIAVGLRSGFGDDFLRIGSVKAFADGALGPRTAAMLQSYENEPGNRGILLLDAEELYERARQAVVNGLSLAVHAIGDHANHEVLMAFDQLADFERSLATPDDRQSPAEAQRPLRHRIEHVQIIHPADAPILAKLGVTASMQPIHATSDFPAADRFWGARSKYAYAWRTLRDLGVCLAFGSDAPVESPNPFLGLHAAITRQRPDGSPGPQGWYPAQRLTIGEALSAFTHGAAYAAGVEDRLGKLAPGYLADLIVLDTDPLTCEPEAIREIQPLATMVAGEWVWSLMGWG